MTITAADGQTTELELVPERTDCAVVGAINRTEAARSQSRPSEAEESFGLGPYDVVVELALDGATYEAQTTWPVPGGLPEGEWAVPLSFTPDLPFAMPDDYRDLVG